MDIIKFIEENCKYIVLGLLLLIIYYIINNNDNNIEGMTNPVTKDKIKWYKDVDKDGVVTVDTSVESGADYFGHGYIINDGGVAVSCENGKYNDNKESTVCTPCQEQKFNMREILSFSDFLNDTANVEAKRINIYNDAFGIISGGNDPGPTIYSYTDSDKSVNTDYLSDMTTDQPDECIPAYLSDAGVPRWDIATKYKVLFERPVDAGGDKVMDKINLTTATNPPARRNLSDFFIANLISTFLDYDSDRGLIKMIDLTIPDSFKGSLDLLANVADDKTILDTVSAKNVIGGDKMLMDVPAEIEPYNIIRDLERNISTEISNNIINIINSIADDDEITNGPTAISSGSSNFVYESDSDVLFIEHLYKVLLYIQLYIVGIKSLPSDKETIEQHKTHDYYNQLERFLKILITSIC